MVGASLSLTGDFSVDGQAFQRGYKLWASDVNSSGGLLGRRRALAGTRLRLLDGFGRRAVIRVGW